MYTATGGPGTFDTMRFTAGGSLLARPRSEYARNSRPATFHGAAPASAPRVWGPTSRCVVLASAIWSRIAERRAAGSARCVGSDANSTEILLPVMLPLVAPTAHVS